MPKDSREIEGTTFVTESLYVAVGVHKVVVDSKVKGHEYLATTTNTLGCGDKDTNIVGKRPGHSIDE